MLVGYQALIHDKNNTQGLKITNRLTYDKHNNVLVTKHKV